MDYDKVDVGILSTIRKVINSDRKNIKVLISLNDRIPEEQIRKYRIINHDDSIIITATLSANEIDELSNQKWVKSIKLSRQLTTLIKEC